MTDCYCRRGLPRFVRPAPLVPLLLALLPALLLAGALFPAGPAHAEEVTVTPDTRISVEAQLPPGETNVPHGASVVYRVSRTGDTDGALDLVLQTREPARYVIGGVAPSENLTDHNLRFQPGEAEVSVRAPVLGGRRTFSPEYIAATIVPSRTDDYISNVLNPVTTGIRRSVDDDVIVTISAAQDSIAEGGSAGFTLTRTGATASTLTATVRVEDPDAAMRGNHWDPALPAEDFTKSVTFAAGAETATVSFPTRPNLRDTGDLTLTAEVRQDEDYNYWVGATFTADVTVTDDDTAAEFSLSVSPAAIDEGEDVTFTLTRHGDVSQALEEVPFVLRIGADYRRWIWPQWVEPQDYGAAMDAGRSALDYNFTVHSDGSYDNHGGDFRFEAEFKLPEAVPDAHLAEYFSVRGERKVGASVRNVSRQQVWIASIGDDTFDPNDHDEGISHENYSEGQEVPFVIGRSGSAEQIAEELVVQFRYFEINHPYRRGSYLLNPDTYFNPSDQRMFMTFPAGETSVSGSFVIDVDDVPEGLRDDLFIVYFPRVPYVDYWSFQKLAVDGHYGFFRDNPRAISIALAQDDSNTIEEGETAEFVLTRGGSTDRSLTLDVAIDDPGDFRRGNHWMNTPDRTVAVTFDAGSDTAALSVPTSDDWRDIPDNTITATIPPSQDGSYRPAYETEGETSASVTVEDNDVAPNITLSASTTKVVEGQAASFTFTRDNADTPQYMRYEFGLESNERTRTTRWAVGQTQLTVDVATEDDDYDDPDEMVYVAKFLPLRQVPLSDRSQYWTIEGPSSARITVTDNDLPLVGVDEVERSYQEWGQGHVRFVRDGQTGDELDVKYTITQDGNSLFVTEQIGVEQTIYIPAGEESSLTYHLLTRNDGDEDDTTLTVTAVAATDQYRIDPERASATFTVIDRDPLPVLSISDATASEGDGTIDFQVSIESTVSPPSRREMQVFYTTLSGSAESGEDYTGTVAILTIPPLATTSTISIPLLDDGLVEEEESFTLKLNFPINVVLQDGQETLRATGTITDDEPTVSVSAVSDEVDEGDTAVLEFVRTGSTAEALTVYFARIYELSPGGARVVHTTQSLEIPAGQASAQLSIETEDDGLDTVDREFGISVVPPTWEGLTRYYRQDPATAWVTIKDTDLPVVSVEADSEGVHESYDAVFTLDRVGRIDIALTVNVTVTQVGSFFPSGDPPSTVTFAVGSETATLTLATVGDSTLEDHGSVTVAIAEGDDYEVGLPASATTAVADNDRSGVSVSIAGESAAVDEGENVVFTVTRTGGEELAGLTVRVNVYEVRDHLPWIHNEEKLAEFVELENLLNTGPRGTDGARSLYSENRYDVEFAAGSATATITIATEDESYNDGNSYFRAELPLSVDYQVDPFPGRAEVWVRDDDIPTVHVTPEELTVVEDGVNIPQYTFHRTGDTSAALWVGFDRYSIVRWANRHIRSPTRGLRHIRRPIRAGSSSLALHEGLRATTPPDGRDAYVLLQPHYCETVPGDCGTASQYRVGSPNSSSIKLLNDAQAVRIEADQDSVTEGEAATFTLTRHGGTPQGREYALGVRVQVTQNGQFIDGVPPQTVRFSGHPVVPLAEASDTATLTIPTLDDDVYEAGGSIEVLVLPSTETAALLGQRIYEPSIPASASVTVADNDMPAVTVSDASASEDEGTMQFTVSVPAAYGRLTVDWETSDGSGENAATAGSDYEAASGQVVFNHGEAERTISVNITDDSDEEGNETFTVTLKNPVGLVLPADPTATGTILDDDGSAGGPMIGELPSGVDVTITAAESSVEEGAAAAFTITRAQGSGAQSDSSSDDPLSVSLALSQEGDFFSPSAANFSGAAVTYDIASATADVTIPAGELSVTLDLATDDDDVAEADGSITLTVAEGTGYEVGFPAIATTNVTDNDVGISISGVTQSEDKGEMTFTVSLSRAADEAVTVVASTMDGTATSSAAVTATSLGKDFESKTETLTISAGGTEAQFTVTLLDDTIDEDAEEFTVALSSPSDNAGLLDESATGAINDNDDPMTVGVYRVGRTVNENAEGPVVFRFQVTPQADSTTTATERAITVRWTVLPGTATAGEDYVAVATAEKTVIPAGVTTRSVEVTLTDDSLFEAIEETFTFEIKGAVNAVKNTDHQSIEMSIRDDEGMRADVLPVSPVVAEGEDAVFTVFLSESVSTAPVKIIYSVVGTAGPSDYVAPSGTLTIPAGETSGAVAIATVADEIVDQDETLGVLLTRATTSGREVITPEDRHFVTILDTNTLSASFVSSTPADEGDAVEFTVRLSIASDQTVRVGWETEDVQGRGAQATAGVDYTSATGTVEFSAGETSAAFTVETLEDSIYEGDEVFGARLKNAVRVENADSEVAVPLGTSSLVATIRDDDPQPTDITLTAAPASVDEGAGETEFTVTGTLTDSNLLTGDVEIALNLEGSISEDEDVDDTEPPTLTISAGQVSGTTTIAATPLDDEVDDDGASIRITGTSDGFAVTEAIVTVTDDDGPPTGVTLALSQNTIREGDGETELTVTATLTGGGLRTEDTPVALSVAGVSIPSTVQGEEPSVAADSNDFAAQAATLTIPARQRSGTATVAITPVDDIVTEGPETARISGENDDLAVTPARLTIEDNDQDATGIRLSVSPASVTEKDGVEQIEVTATLTGGGVRQTATTVVLTVADVSARTGQDYTAASTDLVIPSGQLSGTANVSINLIDDNLDEPTERVAIRGTNDDPGLPVTGARVSINDDDLPPTGIVLSVDRSTVRENLGFQAVQVTAEVQGNARSTKTVVSLATANGTAIHSTDYRPSSGLLTIPAGQKTGAAPFLVAPIDDQLDEDDETLSIGGSTSLRSLNVQSALISITDDDTAGVAITPNALTIDEGNSGSYRVALQTQPSQQVTVTVTGHAGADLSLDKTTLTFTASNWGTPQAVTVTAGEDADGTDDSVTLTHTAAGGEYADVAADLSVTVVDDDTASVVLTPTTLSVDEGDATGDAYTVELATQPSAEVTVTVTGQANTDLTLTGLSGTGTHTFTTENWNTAQTVTVTAAEDADGADDSVTLTHTAAGGNYAGETADLAVTVDDDETVSVVLSESSLSVDEEDATGAGYTVRLSHQPSEQVTVTVSGRAGTDLTLTGLSATNTLTFATDNWDTAQTVTVTAGHDADGANDSVTLTHTAAGGEYADAAADLAVTVIDDDRAIVLSETSLRVEEGNRRGPAYTVKLATQPSENVTVAISGHADSDVSLDKSSLTFTTGNWNAAQTVKVTTAEDDDGADDSVTLTHTAAGGEYAGVAADLAVTVVDDETVSLVLSETTLSVDEDDTTGSNYTVKLSHQPSEQVTVTVSSRAGTDLTLTGLSATNTLTFTADDWDTAQTVTVTAGHDADGANDSVTLTHTAAGGEYADAAADLAVTVVDNDRAIVLSPTSLSVDEGDDTGAAYTVKLATQPSETVTVAVSGHTGTDVSVDKTTLTFTTANWNTAQTVTVTAGQDDDGADDAATLTHTAAGGEYADVAADLSVTVVDDDRAIVLTPTSLTVDEGDDTGATYTVKLATQPSAEVTVTVTGHTGTDVSVDKASLTFTTDNWSTAQAVTVTAGHDADGADDSETLTHTAAGGEYASVTATLAVTVVDDDRAIVLSRTSLSVDEGDATGATYTVKLATQPSGEVTVAVSGHTDTDVSVDKASLTFTIDNWNTTQTVTVTAADDADGADDAATLTHTAAGGEYAGATATLPVTVVDDDRAIVLNPTSLTVTEGDTTGVTYTVKLATRPSHNVIVAVLGQHRTDVTSDKISLTFNASNWDTAQTVTVTAAEDADGADDSVTLTHTATGGNYGGETANLAVTVDDDETVALVLSESTLSVNEEDATGASYNVKLGAQPSETVTVTVTGQASTDLTITGLSSTNTMTFNTANWNTAQTVTVTAADDADGADDAATLTHTAAGGEYADVAADLSVTVVDNDRAIVLTPTSLTVDEGDATGATYTVKLATQPSAEVTVTVTGQAGTDLSLTGLSGTGTLTFTTDNWDTAQTVGVTAGQDDDGADDAATLTHTATGGEYASVTAALPVTVVDDDRAIVLTPTTLSVDEGGATGATYTVKLATQPSEEVTVTVTGHAGTDVSVDKTTLTFTTENWNTAQSVTVKAGQDDDGADDAVTLTHTATGGEYEGETADLAVTVDDYNPPTGISLTIAPMSIGEEAGETEVTVTATLTGGDTRLVDTEVTLSVAGVSIPPAEEDGEPTIAATSADFTATDGETLTIPAGQSTGTTTITFTPTDDNLAEGDETTHVSGLSDDLEVTSALLTIVDNDQLPTDLYFSVSRASVGEGDGYVNIDLTATLSGGSPLPEKMEFEVWILDLTTTVRSDYLGDLQVIMIIPAGEMIGYLHPPLEFTILDDNIHEPTERFRITAFHPELTSYLTIHSAFISIIDDDELGLDLSPAPLTVTEGDTTGETYAVKLKSQPSEEVTVMVTGQSGTDLTLTGLSATNTLTFTTDNWDTAQTVTVKAGNDTDGADDPETLTHTASGGNFEGVTADLAVTVDDDETVSVVLTPTALSVDEGDDTGATYTVKLATQPSETVTVTVTGQANTDLTLTGLSATNALTFIADNWNTAQTVTATAADDADGADDSVTLTHTAEGGENASVTATLPVTVVDDDRAIVLSEAALSVAEGSATGVTYTVKLATQPSENVTVAVSGHTGTDVSVDKASLIFTTDNWDSAQTVKVTAAEDADGADDAVTLTHTATGGNYDGETADLAVTVDDDEMVSLVLSESALSVDEGDTTGADYTIRLSHQPSEDVTVTATGHSGSDLNLTGLSGTSTLTFTTDNWDTAQTVTVTAAHDDDGADDTATLTHTVAGGEYASVTAALPVTVVDDDRAIVLSPASLSVDEGDTTGVTYTVKLATQPSETVTVAVSGHTGTDVSVDKTTLTFTTGNWNTAQTVKVTAADDADGADDSETLTHTAAGGEYVSVTATLPVKVVDNDRAIVLTPTSLSVDEGDDTGATYTVKLATQPSETVTVTVTGQANTDLTLTGLSATNALTFIADNWNTAQTVTATAADDADGADDSVTLTHTAEGGEYASVTATLPVTVVDDDRAIVLSEAALSVAEGSATGVTYTVKLATQPSENVTVAISGHTDTDVSVDKASLIFTTDNWDSAQTVKVTAAEDADGADDAVTLTHTATGGNYDGETADLAVTVDDDETVSLVLSESALSVDEGDTTGAGYTVKLSHRPSEQVTVTVSGQASTELTLTGLSGTNTLTFTASNWNTAQRVTVTAGHDDDGADDEETLRHTATGGEYDSVTADLPVTVVDDDRGIVLSRTSLSVDEGSATGASYTVKLAAQPSAEVTVTVTGHSGTDVSVDKASLTFTTGNWDTAQAVTVTAGHDLDGGDDTVTLTHTAAGGEYTDVTADLPVTVIDDDKSLQTSATVSFANTNISVAEGATTTVSVQLSPSLSEVITVGLTTTNQSGATSADYSGVPATLEFASGDTTKSFTFVAETDLVDELDEVVVIGFGTLPEGLGAGADNQATITIRDATSISISFDSGTYSATEGGSDAAVTVELSAAPAQQVEITLTATGHDGATSGDWSGVPSSLTFGSGETSKSFTVTAVDDTVEDDGEMVELGFGALPVGFVAGAHATARVTLMNDDQQDQEETDTEQPVATCDDAHLYAEVDIVVDNNGKELPDQAANIKGNVPVVEVGHALEGYIAPCFDWDMFGFKLEEGKYYRLDYLGRSSSDGTLINPNILGLFTDGPQSSLFRTEAEPVWYRFSDGKRPFSVFRDGSLQSHETVWVDAGAERQDNWKPMTEGNIRGGLGENARQYLMHFPAGTYYALLIGTGYDIGTYRIRLTEVSDDDSGIRSITLGIPATGSLDFVGDEDTFEVTLTAGTTYDINIDPIKGSGWEHTSAPRVNRVEDVAASTVHDYPLTTDGLMRSFTFTSATTGIHRFTVMGQTWVGPEFGDGEYRLTVAERIPVPSAPQNLTVSSLTHDSVTLTWEAPEDSVVESYQILRRSLDDREYGDHHGSTKFVVIADEIGSGETSYTDTSVEPRTRYVYRMKARNERGLGERSNYANADTPTENSAATGAPTISGTVRVGQTLTADITGIDDADGLNDVSYSYQWLAGDMEITDATNASYMLDASDLGKSIKVRVDFTDDAGHQESLTSQPVGPVDHQVSQQRINSPPTGAPTISGTAQVEETLTADTTGIADEDGLDDATFAYQWVRSDGSDEEDIQNATGSTYNLTEDDVGKTIRVRVSFTDEAGSEESLTSAPTATVIAAVPGAPQSLDVQPSATGQLAASWQAPASDGGAEITGYTVQWKVATNSWDTAEDVSSAATTETSFTITSLSLGTEYSVRVIATNSVGDGEASEEVIETAVALTSEQQEAAQNNPATGMPTIRGTAQVGETLTADTSGISDEDGLTNPTFSYQWVRNDGSTDTDIRDATSSTYILTSDEEGKTLKVKVSFTDDAGNEETLTSAGLDPPSRPYGLTATVSDGAVVLNWNPPVGFQYLYDYQVLRNRPELGETEPIVYVDTGTAETTYTETDVEPGALYVYRVKAANYFNRLSQASEPVEIRTPQFVPTANSPASGAPTISGTAQVGETLTANTSGIADEDGLTNATFSYQWLADDADISGATNASYTLTDSDEGKTVKVTVTFTDDAGNEELVTSVATDVVASPPTTLTGSIHDAPESHDGENSFTFELRFSETPEPDFSYEALRDRAFTATGGTVTNARRIEPPGNVRWEITVEPSSDVDATIVLPVTTDCDDQGAICTADGRMLSAEVALTVAGPEEEEEQTPPENNPATGAPAISGTAQVGQTLTAITTGITDADGLNNVSYSYQWIRTDGTNDTGISGATDSTYTLVDADNGKAIKVQVSFTDDEGNEESLTSAATDAVTSPPTSLTASIHDAPEQHDGENSFTFELRFSETPVSDFSYKTLRDHSFTVTGGTVKKAQRLEQGSNVGWRITVRPDGNGQVAVVLPETTDCDAQGAICTEDSRMLSHRLELTVSGP